MPTHNNHIMANSWRVDGNIVSHEFLKEPLVIPVAAHYTIVASTDTSLDLESHDKCSVHIEVRPGSVECDIDSSQRETPPLPDWVKCIVKDMHVCGYDVNRPHTFISDESPIIWRCTDDPDKLFMIASRIANGMIYLEGGMLELSFPRGDTTLTTVWRSIESRVRHDTHTVTCVDAAGRTHRLVIIEGLFVSRRIQYSIL